MYSDEGRTPRNRRRQNRTPSRAPPPPPPPDDDDEGPSHEGTPDMMGGRRFSPEAYLRYLSRLESQRQRVRSRTIRQTRGDASAKVKAKAAPALSLAERIMISRLDPENFSMETTRSPVMQQAVAMTPHPPLGELIKQYRSMESEEMELEQAVMEKMRESRQCLTSMDGSSLNLHQRPGGGAARSAAGERTSSAINMNLTLSSATATTRMQRGAETRPPASVRESLSQSEAPRQDDFGSARESLSQSAARIQNNFGTLSDQSPHQNEVGAAAAPVVNRPSVPGQDLTEESSAAVAMIPRLENHQPQDQLCESKDAKTTMNQPQNSSVQESPQRNGFVETSLPSSDGNGAHQNPGENPQTTSSDLKGGNPTQTVPDTERLSAEKRAAYLQRHNQNPNEKKHTRDNDAEQYNIPLERQTRHSQAASEPSNEHRPTERGEHGERVQSGLQENRGSGDGCETPTDDVPRNVCLPAIQGRITQDPAGKLSVNADPSPSLPSISEPTAHPQPHVNNDLTQGSRIGSNNSSSSTERQADECADIHLPPQPSSTLEKLRFPGESEHGGDINIGQLERLQLLDSTVDDITPSVRDPSQQEQRETEELSGDRVHAHAAGFSSDRINDCEATDPLTSTNNGSQLENNNTAPGKEGEANAEEETAEKSINNIFIGKRAQGTPPPLHFLRQEADMDTKKAEVNRLHLPRLDTDPRTVNTSPDQEVDRKGHKDTGAESNSDFVKYRDQISIRISSVGGVRVSSAYSSPECVPGENDARDLNKKDLAGKHVTQNAHCERDSRLEDQQVFSTDKKGKKSQNVKIVDKLHVQAKAQRKDSRPVNFPAITNHARHRARTYKRGTQNLQTSVDKSSQTTPGVEDGHLHDDSLPPLATSLPRHKSQAPNFRNRKGRHAFSPGCCCGQCHTFTSVTRVHFHEDSKDNSSTDTDDGVDDDDDDNDDRIYDFIGLSRRRSYTLPEIVTRKPVSQTGIQRRSRIEDNDDEEEEPFDVKTKPFLPELGVNQHQKAVPSTVRSMMRSSSKRVQIQSRTMDDSHPSVLRLPELATGGGDDDVTPKVPLGRRRFGSSQSLRSMGQGDVKLPDLQLQRKGHVVSHRHRDEKVTDARQHRVLRLYQELKQINLHSVHPSTLRLNVTRRRDSDLRVRIEWGRRLPEGDNTLKVKYRATARKPEKKTRQDTADRLRSERKLFRRNYSETFIFLDDDVFPQVELLRHKGEGFRPDVMWFTRPGVASEQCDVGFVDPRLRGRKGRAWTSLKTKRLSRVNVMKSLEMKTFANIPKIKLN